MTRHTLLTLVTWVLLLAAVVQDSAAQEKWAVILGVAAYPNLTAEFPPIRAARQDALAWADALVRHSQFSPDKVFCLTDRDATKQAIHHIFSTQLAQSKPEDLVLFFFAGHGLQDEQFHRFYLLLSESDANAPNYTAISLDELAELYQAYVPSRHLWMCLDARRSTRALGSSWYTSLGWATGMAGKDVSMLEASAPHELAKERGGQGLFTYFFTKSLQGVYFLEKSPDANKDSFITVTEMNKYLCWAMALSGLAQHPQAWGKTDKVLQPLAPNVPHIQLITSQVVKARDKSEFPCSGFLRSPTPVTRLAIENFPVDYQLLSESWMSQYQVIPGKYTYLFSSHACVPIMFPKLRVEIVTESTVAHSDIPLRWSFPGWYDEWMPPDMDKGATSGIYRWKKDQSEMVYVPRGPFQIGMTATTPQQIVEELREQTALLTSQYQWLQQDYNTRKEITLGLEETQEAIYRISHKLKSIYDRSALFANVGRHLGKLDAKALQPPTAKDNIATELLDKQPFIVFAQDLLRSAYYDLRALLVKQKEAGELLAYLTAMAEMDSRIETLYPEQTMSIPAFYIDRYELNNQQYREFCEATARLFPPPPWWDDNYLFERPAHPVVNVSWEDAQAYAYWAGKHLPTSLQWERSARGTDGRTFPWGNEVPTQQNVHADVPVAVTEEMTEWKLPSLFPLEVRTQRFPPSPAGCYHMAGNVQEWCLDAPNFLPEGFATQPSRDYRIIKGGSFVSPSLLLRSWFYQPFLPGRRRSDLGFRCAVSFR